MFVVFGLLGLIDRGIVATTVFYGKFIKQVLRLRYVVLVLFFCVLAATVYLYRTVPSAFLPTEDQNYLICIVQTPPGGSLQNTAQGHRPLRSAPLRAKRPRGIARA